jgi:hypothetical protein
LPSIRRAGFEVTMERVTAFRVMENEVIALNNQGGNTRRDA